MRLLVFGDSVPWGQGLTEGNKYHSLLAAALKQNLPVDKYVFAHSGATIGLQSARTDSADGEIPISWPTIAEQVRQASTLSDATVVLLNGGINDIDIRTILNPSTDERDLDEDIERYCYQDYSALLATVLRTFPKALVVTTGYYPILSDESDWTRLFNLLQGVGVGSTWVAPTPSLIEKVVSLSLRFWKGSDAALARAVADCQDASRAIYLPLPFDEKNSVFTKEACLFGLTPVSLEPEDEVIGHRRQVCMSYYNEPKDLFSLFQCIHASAGHPNVRGAAAIGETLIALVKTKLLHIAA